MPLFEENLEEDNLPDAVGETTRAIVAIKTWTTEKHKLVSELMELLKKEKYSFFTGNKRTYGMGSTGEHVLYQVPSKQLGHLSRYRGKLVRIVCLGGEAGFGARTYCAKIVK